MWKFFEKRPFFWADMAGLGKYHTGGYGRIGVYRVKACLCLEVKFRLYMCVAGGGVTPLGLAPKILNEKPKHSNCKGSKHISSRLSSVGHTIHVQITSYSIQDFYFEHLNCNVSSLFHIFFSNTAKLME